MSDEDTTKRGTPLMDGDKPFTMTGPDGVMREVTIAPQEALRFVGEVGDVFMADVLNLSDYMITDESMIYDFGPWDDQQTMEDFERVVIEKAGAVFGVDITPVIEEKLPTIFQYIRAKLPDFPATP
jgi:hypothetical protein